MSQRYSIFISSTYKDLRDERDQVMRAILELGHFPIGMELFSAADEDQWTLIKQQIDEADYYLVILANRYGSRDGIISFTEKEYEYAINAKVPALGFVLADGASWPVDRNDKDKDDIDSLREFKEKVKSRQVAFWNDAEELSKNVVVSLAKAINRNPRPGWVRGGGETSRQMADELARLSAENAELRADRSKKEVGMPSEQEQEFSRLAKVMQECEANLSIRDNDQAAWQKARVVTLLDLFLFIGKYLIFETPLDDLSQYIGNKVKLEGMSIRGVRWPVASNLVSDTMIDFQSIGLAEPTKRDLSRGIRVEYWRLTEKGKSFLFWTRLRLKFRDLSGEASPDEPEANDASAE